MASGKRTILKRVYDGVQRLCYIGAASANTERPAWTAGESPEVLVWVVRNHHLLQSRSRIRTLSAGVGHNAFSVNHRTAECMPAARASVQRFLARVQHMVHNACLLLTNGFITVHDQIILLRVRKTTESSHGRCRGGRCCSA